MSRKVAVSSLVGLAVFALFLASGCVFSSSSSSATAGDAGGSLTWDGLERTYLVHVPRSWDRSRSMPLLIALHGGLGTGRDMVRLTLGGLDTLADEDGFIVAYPDGIDQRWNDGRSPQFSQVDDVGFISALIDRMAQAWNIDRSRVYVTGISNGAQMTMRLARELSDKITAVAVVGYAMPQKEASVPLAGRPISVLVMTGTEDPFIPWQGGPTPDRSGERDLGVILSVPATMELIRIHDGCPSEPTVTWEPDRDPNDGTRVQQEVFADCTNGTGVTLYSIQGGGHTWPGGRQYLPVALVGRTSRDIDADQVIWNFFQAHLH